MSSFIIKIIAIISMTFDHTGDALIGHFTWFNLIGRIAFPLFAFQIVVGYSHTHDVKKYLLRLFLFGILSQVPFAILNYEYAKNITLLNVFFTFTIGIIAMLIYDTKKIPALLRIAGIVGLFTLANLINVDYEAWGIILILFMHVFLEYEGKSSAIYDKSDILTYPYKLSKNVKTIIFIIGMLLLSLIRYLDFFKLNPLIALQLSMCTFIPTIIIMFYNGKKGPSLKYFFYIYYPLHLIILDVLHYLVLS